jgi:hypothetical protein
MKLVLNVSRMLAVTADLIRSLQRIAEAATTAAQLRARQHLPARSRAPTSVDESRAAEPRIRNPIAHRDRRPRVQDERDSPDPDPYKDPAFNPSRTSAAGS